MDITRRKVFFKSSTIPYIERMGIEKTIEGYNRLLTLPQHATVDDQIQILKKQLVERNIITEDHEGPIDVS